MTPASPGLCDSCVHARKVPSAKGSSFVLCERSVSDPRYPRYPRLPVVRCEGYEERAAGALRDGSIDR